VVQHGVGDRAQQHGPDAAPPAGAHDDQRRVDALSDVVLGPGLWRDVLEDRVSLGAGSECLDRFAGVGDDDAVT
jgi:hypothetical protein